MRRSLRIAVATLAVSGIFTLGAAVEAKSPPAHHHSASHSKATKARSLAKPQHTLTSSRKAALKKSGGPIFVPQSKAQQAKEIHDQRVKDAKNGGPIFVPQSKAQQAKEIHDQRMKDAANGGPIFVPESKAQQAKDIHDRRVQEANGRHFPKSKAEQAKEIHDQRMQQMFHRWYWHQMASAGE